MIFKINNLICRYGDGPPVLKVNDLNIPKGGLCFVIGASGIGKSTLLETLGLMNDTVMPNTDSVFDFSSPEGEILSLKDVWNSDGESLSSLRNKYFSFIFQHTNLMPHFSAGENMIISQLISGVDAESAKSKVLSVMKSLHLDRELYDRNITELSGGQRQRLAFVRAFTASFEVLFGDEPTGNLDPVTSEILLTMLKKFLRENNKSGIIVSHDIDHAIEFADKILPIKLESEGKNSRYGWMDESISWVRVAKNRWQNKLNELDGVELKQILINYLSEGLQVQKEVKDE